MPLTDNDIARISAALRAANFHLIRADLTDQNRELQVTVEAPLGPQLGKERGPQKSACGRYEPSRAAHVEIVAIPWGELTDREKFVVIGDIIALLRR
jgi:hypothetical protein